MEGAFRGIQKAAELIDMRKQKGAHPRMGATDVCPFIPVSNVSWEEAIACAKSLGEACRRRVENPGLSLRESGERSGAVESLRSFAPVNTKDSSRRSKQPAWKPDFGPAVLQRDAPARP